MLKSEPILERKLILAILCSAPLSEFESPNSPDILDSWEA